MSPKKSKGKGKDGSDGSPEGKKDKKPKRAARPGGIRPFRFGLLLAIVVAGPPLYTLVQDGSIDSMAAFQKVAIVALAAAIGFSWVAGLVVDYQAQVELARRQREERTQEILRMIEEENAARQDQPDDGGPAHPASAQPTP